MKIDRIVQKIILIGIIGWISWNIYSYLFDTVKPIISIKNLKENEFYSGNLQCEIFCNKKAYISISLNNDKPVQNVFIKPSNNPYVFKFDTTTISNGISSLIVKATDTKYQKNNSYASINFIVDNKPLIANLKNFESEIISFAQGKTLACMLDVNKPIKSAFINGLGKTYPAVIDDKNESLYYCFMPIDCQEQLGTYPIKIEINDYVGNNVVLEKKLEIIDGNFKKQLIGINTNTIKEEKEIGRPAKELEEEIKNILASSPMKKMWKGSFCTPIDIQRTTCEFGTIRTTQHKGRYAHGALDIINAPKSVVWATQKGTVVLKDRFEHSGNTVVIDHGCGILSLFFHLDSFANIERGQIVNQGNPIGTIGKTGHATGYHLHWEMRAHNTQVDPMQWTTITL